MQETGHGLKLDRCDWTDDDLAGAVARVLTDKAMADKLAATSSWMKAQDSRHKAVRLLDELLARHARARSRAIRRRLSVQAGGPP